MTIFHETSELFMSIEGEGPYTGHPTLYIRYAKCNLKCPGFNNPEKKYNKEGYALLEFNPKDYNSLQELPEIHMGCDTQYSTNPEFSHLWERLSTEQLVDKIISILPHKSWIHPKTKQPIILSLTGGEPLLRQKQIPSLLNHPLMKDCQHVLFETNCSVPIRDDFINALNQWWKPGKKITFSNSPKLSASGEKWEDAIKLEVAVKQQLVKHGEQYFKFVCGPREEDFEEVERVMQTYWDAGVVQGNNVYIMPESCTVQQQNNIAEQVAHMCVEKGYILCYRVHVSVFNNKIGT